MTPPWLEMARREIGTKEDPSQHSNSRILDYFKETTFHAEADEVPWCSAFVCAMLEWSGVPSTRSAAAKSYIHYGNLWTLPQLGCITVLNRAPGKYHVGFFEFETATTVGILGGNQSDMVKISEFDKKLVVCYRLPLEEYWSPYREPDNDKNPGLN
jgi:uncharacterized protein (TIGR02594 family)